MVDDSELAAFDPFDILDREANRIDDFLDRLGPSEWAKPTRCAGWTVRDLLGHLASSEDYHQACLDGAVKGLLASIAQRGGTDADSFNALGVADVASIPTAEVLERWRTRNGDTRRRFRQRGSAAIDTSIGLYPCRWQAFHVASELATHADDMGVDERRDERDQQRVWRTAFSRFALTEAKPDLAIAVAGGRTVVSDATIELTLDDDELIAGVAGRLDDSSRLGAAARSLLSTMP